MDICTSTSFIYQSEGKQIASLITQTLSLIKTMSKNELTLVLSRITNTRVVLRGLNNLIMTYKEPPPDVNDSTLKILTIAQRIQYVILRMSPIAFHLK